MPFVSKAQQRACYAQKADNPDSTWDCGEWAAKTNFKKLPETKEAGDAADPAHVLADNIGKSLYPRPSLGRMTASGGLLGSLVGVPLGAAAGVTRGNTPEGIGRGMLRGGATGIGTVLGEALGQSISPHSSLAGLLGAGAGAGVGYLGSGALLGKPVGRPKKEKEKEKMAVANNPVRDVVLRAVQKAATVKIAEDRKKLAASLLDAVLVNLGSSLTPQDALPVATLRAKLAETHNLKLAVETAFPTLDAGGVQQTMQFLGKQASELMNEKAKKKVPVVEPMTFAGSPGGAKKYMGENC